MEYTINKNLNEETGRQFEVIELNVEIADVLYPDMYRTKSKALARRLAYRWNKQELQKLSKPHA